MKKISYKRIGEYLQTAFKIIIENGGSYPSRDITSEMEKRLIFNDYETERYEKTGYIRWQSILHFYSIDCTKAGWLKKGNGIWYVTDDGEKALNMDSEKFILHAVNQFRQWKKENKGDLKITDVQEESEVEDELIENNRTLSYEQSLETARKEIENYIENM